MTQCTPTQHKNKGKKRTSFKIYYTVQKEKYSILKNKIKYGMGKFIYIKMLNITT
jgi:hypothetical protein